MLNMDQTQRRDIDTTLDDRLTLAIDEENIADNPYIFEPTVFQGNNWFKQGNNIVKLNLAEQDSLIFLSSPLVKLAQKDITNVIVSFDYQVSNVSVNYPILSNISLTCMEMTNYMLVENILTTQGHIDVDCSLFNFSSNVVNTSISEQGFKVGINFNGNKSNATIKLSNVQIQFKYQNKLSTQEDSVVNRLEPHIDFWREDDDLVLQIGGDATGKGMDHSGGDVDTYTKEEIDAKLDLKVNTETGKGLSSNDYTLTEKTKLSGIAENANYYIHPSTHGTGIIVESNALNNLETSANATQHEINLAIDNKINTGGGSVDWSDIENKPSDYPPSTHNHDDRYYTETEIDTALNTKQATLVSGTNIKTVNNQSLLGSGNIVIQGGGTGVDIATSWGNPTSDSKVPSEKLVKDSLDGKANSSHTHTSNQVTDLIDTIYPVGSIYMSVSNTSPSILFGGTWEQIKDKFLLSSGDTYNNGATGGSANAVVVSHNHTQNAHQHGTDYNNYAFVVTEKTDGASNKRVTAVSSGSTYVPTDTSARFHNYSKTNAQTPTINSQGESGTGKNMPPYLAVNVWKRTA